MAGSTISSGFVLAPINLNPSEIIAWLSEENSRKLNKWYTVIKIVRLTDIVTINQDF